MYISFEMLLGLAFGSLEDEYAKLSFTDLDYFSNLLNNIDSSINIEEFENNKTSTWKNDFVLEKGLFHINYLNIMEKRAFFVSQASFNILGFIIDKTDTNSNIENLKKKFKEYKKGKSLKKTTI